MDDRPTISDDKSLHHHEKDVHTCGSCRTEFDNLEEFIHHKLTVEGYRLFYSPSGKDVTVSVPHFLPALTDEASNQDGNSNFIVMQEKPDLTNNDQTADVEYDAPRNVYRCQVCDRVYAKEVFYQRHFDLMHQAEVNPQGPFRCSKCGTSFKKRQTLKVHWLSHNKNRKFHCPYKPCHCAFKTKGSLVRHIRRHTGEKPYSCDQCNRRFSESGALSKHLKTSFACNQKSKAELSPCTSIYSDYQIPLDCQQGYITGDVTNQQRNNQLEIEENAEINLVDVQVNIQSRKNLVNRRKMLRNKKGEKPHKPHCPICGKQFKLKGTMRRHLQDHCADEERQFMCGICHKMFKRSSTVKEHILLVHQDQGPSHICHICSKDFKTQRSLKAHIETHTAELRFPCPHCGHRFRTKYSMLRHEGTHAPKQTCIADDAASAALYSSLVDNVIDSSQQDQKE